MRTASLLTAILIAVALASLQHVYADSIPTPSINVTVTNSTVYVSITNVTVFKFVKTIVYVGLKDLHHLRVSYSCIYTEDYTKDCVSIIVRVRNETTTFAQIDFAPSSSICRDGLCHIFSDVDIDSARNVTIDILNATTGELIQSTLLVIPRTEITYTSYLQWVATLMPIALVVGLAARGSLKSVGIGLICYGIAVRLLPYLNIAPQNLNALSVIAITIGAIMLYLSKG